MYCFWSIPTCCERPDKVLEVLDYMLGDEGWQDLCCGGVEGVNYTVTADGEFDTSEWDAKADSLTEDEKNSQFITSTVRRAKDGAAFFVARSLPKEDRERLENLLAIAVDLAERSPKAYGTGFRPSNVDDVAFNEYQVYMIDEENKIITGEKPLDHWDELLDGWYDAGGQTVVDEATEFIKSTRKD